MRARAVILTVLLAATAHAGVTVQRLTAEAAMAEPAGKKVSMEAHDLDPASLVAAFTQQTGIPVGFNPGGGSRSNGPTPVYELVFADLAPLDAAKELARTLGMGLATHYNGVEGFAVVYNYSGPLTAAEPAAAPVGVELTSVTRQRTVPATPQARDGILLTFRNTAAGTRDGGEPGRQTINGLGRIVISEAVDEQGRTLEDLDAAERDREDAQPRPTLQAARNVRLALPSPRPTKLVRLSGTATTVRPKTVLRVAVDSFEDGPMEAELEGGTVTFGPIVTGEHDTLVPVRLTRGGMPVELWNRLNSVFGSDRIVFTSADGQTLRSGFQSIRNGGTEIEMQIRIFAQRSPRVTRATTGAAVRVTPEPVRPAGVRWDTVIETDETPVRFDLTNVAVP